MRFLADENFPRLAVEELQAAGHDVAWVLTESPSAEDPDILARAVLDDNLSLQLILYVINYSSCKNIEILKKPFHY